MAGVGGGLSFRVQKANISIKQTRGNWHLTGTHTRNVHEMLTCFETGLGWKGEQKMNTQKIWPVKGAVHDGDSLALAHSCFVFC